MNDTTRDALRQIAEQDPVEMALDPTWAKRIAQAALLSAHSVPKSANRPTDEPGGIECMKCGRIFIGGPEHDVCGVCAAAHSVPMAEGWKTVPIEPTDEMSDAAAISQERASALEWTFAHCYRAMINAAPAAPSTPTQAEQHRALSDEQRESVRYAAEWLGRSEDIGNRKHAERLALLANGGKHE
jgi:hypothetical protein